MGLCCQEKAPHCHATLEACFVLCMRSCSNVSCSCGCFRCPQYWKELACTPTPEEKLVMIPVSGSTTGKSQNAWWSILHVYFNFGCWGWTQGLQYLMHRFCLAATCQLHYVCHLPYETGLTVSPMLLMQKWKHREAQIAQHWTAWMRHWPYSIVILQTSLNPFFLFF